jgi:multidrug efflux system outer membrane protein
VVIRPLVIATLSALLVACAVGPDYVRPAMPEAGAFVRQQAGDEVGPQPQPDPQFWRAFGDPLLDRLIEAALAQNHDLRIALANLEQASALSRGARHERFPTLTMAADASDIRSSASQLPGAERNGRDSDRYSVGFGAQWELDVFGRIRRGNEARYADTQAAAADLAAMQVAVVGELARSYIELRGWQEQVRIAGENADTQARTLQLLQLRSDAGMATPFDVDRGRTQLETTQARIPALEARIATSTHRIAVLTGALPGALVAELETPAELPLSPPSIPVDAPGGLLRRRPDVAAAERRLAAATARIGVATADLYPRFTLGGLLGTQALRFGDLFKRDSETRLLSFGLDGSFLNVGQVRARIAAADAAARGDLAAWERAVLVALEETENALARLSNSSVERDHLQHAAQAGARVAGEARLRFEHGAIDVLELLDAERARLAAEDAYAQGRVRNTLAAVALYQALAGGWPEYTPVAAAQ